MSNRLTTVWIFVCVGAIVGLTAGQRRALAQKGRHHRAHRRQPVGIVRTINVNGALDLNNPFFKELGTNGRSCFSCHRPAQGWSITPDSVRRRFDESRGLDPIFRVNDGSNCEGADLSTLPRRRAAFSQLLDKGLIRVGIDVPDFAEFVIEAVDDPYQCGAPLTAASMYRRPLPSTNLRFLSAVMWDGRESTPTTSVLEDLAHQSNNATLGHAQASLDLTTQERQVIVAFETGLFTAQVWDRDAGRLHDAGAQGGPLGSRSSRSSSGSTIQSA